MREIYLIFLIALLSNQFASAEIIKPTGEAILEVTYTKTMSRDTVGNNFVVSSPMTLRIGEKGAMFYPTMAMENDSLNYYNRELAVQVVVDALMKGEAVTAVLGHEHEYLFRNINENETMVYQAVGAEKQYYIEETEMPVWKIGTNHKDILGYECVEASCNYRGRAWHVWFTPEIPVHEGPWKLFGLPGLILEARDKGEHYKFEATEIRQNGLGQIGIFIYDRGSAEKRESRKDYLVWLYRQRIKGNFLKSMSAVTGRNMGVIKDRQYDFEETDYPHE